MILVSHPPISKMLIVPIAIYNDLMGAIEYLGKYRMRYKKACRVLLFILTPMQLNATPTSHYKH